MKTPRLFALTLLFALLAVSAVTAQSKLERKPEAQAGTRVQVVPQPERIAVYPEQITVTLRTDRSSYWEGDDVDITFRVSHDSYLYLFSTDPRGETRMIFPNRYDRDNLLRGGRTYRIPDSSYRMVATGPSGYDTLHAIATTERYDWIDRGYHRISYDDPFPIVQRAPAQFFGEVRRSAESQVNAKVAGQRNSGVATERIAVVPGHLWKAPGYGEAIRTVRVRGRSYYEPPNVRPPDIRSPIIRPPHRDDYDNPGELSISSSPSRAYVYIDGRYVGRTPFDAELKAGRYDVQVYKDGYYPWTTTVDLDPNRRESFRFALRRLPYR
ncbi:MAG: hypothetical protein PWP23_2431 [Candidatus Sumerlaeota bacterium]|nr:hypothetical protein [Candidatus Sumerlaeota bacterium]